VLIFFEGGGEAALYLTAKRVKKDKEKHTSPMIEFPYVRMMKE